MRTALAASLAALAISGCGAGSSLPKGHSNLQSIIEAEGYVHSDPPAALAFLKSLGVDRVRVYVAWEDFAPDPESRQAPRRFSGSSPADYPPSAWSTLDEIVRSAAAVGIGLDLTVGAPAPLWAVGPGAPRGAAYAEDWEPSARDFGRFVHALGVRYSGHYTPAEKRTPLPRVDFWSIWNEPNYGPNLKPQAIDNWTIEVSPKLYRRLVDAAWSSLRATGHTARTDTILIGETAPRGVRGTNGLEPLRFIRALYCVGSNFKPLRGTAASERGCPPTAAGSAKFAAANPALFEASGFADHPYPDLESPTVRTPPPVGDGAADFAALGNLVSTLDRATAAYGRSDQFPIYSTEFGYRTDPPDTAAFGLPLQTAAAYLNEAEYLSWRDPRIRSYDQYLLTDPGPSNNSVFMTGIEFDNGQPKPYVYDAFRMPLWLPVTQTAPGRPLVVWGCVRPADVTRARTHRPQVVEIQFERSGAGDFHTVKRLTVAPASNGYIETSVAFATGGTVRLAWSGSGPTLYSRPQSITLAKAERF